MSAAVDESTDLLLSELEGLVAPCTSPQHPIGGHGHIPDEPGRWIILLHHAPPSYSGTCTAPAVLTFCDSAAQFMLSIGDDGCYCPRCNAIGFARDWFQIIGEV